MACVKCADGNLDRLSHYAEVARADYRDVLSLAEYPYYSGLGHEADEATAIQRDWEQLQEWLQRP